MTWTTGELKLLTGSVKLKISTELTVSFTYLFSACKSGGKFYEIYDTFEEAYFKLMKKWLTLQKFSL